MKTRVSLVLLVSLFTPLFTPLATPSSARAADHVIAISVDGMASSYVEPMLLDGLLPNLKRIIDDGAGTLNARTDADFAITLPNHTAMVTGRGVKGDAGHAWVKNSDPEEGLTLAGNRGHYVPSMFDVAHDAGLRTALWSGKTKFSLYDTSYNETHGAPDTTGDDNGRDKLDHAFVQQVNAAALVDDFVSTMTREPAALAFVHFADPDSAGHRYGWDTIRYREALIAVDHALGRILALIAQNPALTGRTAILITADHGGHHKTHGDTTDLRDTMIPFFVWGQGVAKGDLYAMNPEARANPKTAHPPYDAPGSAPGPGQPIRNGDMANLALDLLGLDAVPTSTINAEQDLQVATPPPAKPETQPAKK